jgi:hypothetical protein
MAGTVNDISSTTQQYLDIYDVSNDILILKDGSTALILTVSAMNFGLLAEPEQDAIMYAYAGLLNSLNYPIQIVIRSQTKDVTSYLQLLKDEEDRTTSDSKRNWIARYRQFVGELIKERNVLDKKFYVSIPATSLEMGLLPPSSVLPGSAQIDISKIERSVILEKAREILEPKRDYLMQQFGRIGLQSRQLTTQEIIQFFYLSYNPEAAEGQQITDTNSYTTPLVSAGMQGGIMMDNVAAPQNTQSNQDAQANQAPAQPASQQPMQPTPAADTSSVMPQTTVSQDNQVVPTTDQTAQPTLEQPTQPMQQPNASQVKPEPAIQVATQPNAAASVETPAQPTDVAPEDVIAPTDTSAQTQPENASVEPTPQESAEIQNEIDSTLKELSSSVSTPSVGASATPTTPIPQNESVSMGSSTPPAQPTAAATAAPTSPMGMPPLPGSVPPQPMGGVNPAQVNQASSVNVPPMTTPNTTNIPGSSENGSSTVDTANQSTPADASKDTLQPLPEI